LDALVRLPGMILRKSLISITNHYQSLSIINKQLKLANFNLRRSKSKGKGGIRGSLCIAHCAHCALFIVHCV